MPVALNGRPTIPTDGNPPATETGLPRSDRRRVGLAAFATLIALVVPVAAAFLVGDDRGLLTGVESAAATSGTALDALAAALPLGYAFGAGMVAAVNPCGFVMLPAYLALYLAEGGDDEPGRLSRVLRALRVSAAVTAGFVALFGAAGVLLGVASVAVAQFFPWAGLLVGGLLVAAGGRMLAGGTLYTALGERVADRLGARARRSGGGAYLAYGVAYGAASLSCTLPIFLTVVGSALTAGSVPVALAEFVLYGLGMGFVLTLVALGTALFTSAAVARGRALTRWVQPASAGLLLLAGAYIVYYWLTIGGLLAALRTL